MSKLGLAKFSPIRLLTSLLLAGHEEVAFGLKV